MSTELEDILYRMPDRVAQQTALELACDENERIRLAEALRSRADLHSRSFGELLPLLALTPDPCPAHRGVSVRTSNLMMRAGIRDWERFARVTPLEIRNIPNCGEKSLREILGVALLGWAEIVRTAQQVPTGGSLESADPTPAADRGDDAAGGRSPGEPEPDAEEFIGELRELLGILWEGGAVTLAEALADAADAVRHGTAGELISALAARPVAEVLGIDPPEESMWRLILPSEERERCLLTLRTLAPDRRVTLTELAQRFGVTRERARQIESQAVAKLEERVQSDAGAGLRHLAHRLARQVGDGTSPERLQRLLEEAVAESSDPDCLDPELRMELLRSLAGPFHPLGEVVLSRAGRVRLEQLERFYSDSAPGELLDSAFLDAVLADLSSDVSLVRPVLDHLGLTICNGQLVRWRGSMADKAVSCLAAYGRQMTMDELHAEIGYDRNPRSIAGQVQGDPRIIRCGREIYGLRSWGGEEYTGILNTLERAVAEAGGTANLDELAERFSREFGVSSGSVHAYAKDRRFVQRGDGVLSMRTADDPEAAVRPRPPERTRGLWLLDGVWQLRMEVDAQHLRGSGSLTSTSVAVAAGLEPDLVLGYEYDGGTVVFSWSGRQPTIGSIRLLVQAHGCGEGDLIFLPLAGEEPRPVRIIRCAARNAEQGVRRLALEAGLDPDDVSAEDPFSVALALGLPAGADWEEISDRLRDRGERTLMDMMPREDW